MNKFHNKYNLLRVRKYFRKKKIVNFHFINDIDEKRWRRKEAVS